QANWALIFGLYDRPVTDDDLSTGAWSAQPDTMRHTLAWLRENHGGAAGYLRSAGADDTVVEALRRRIVDPG
ncbi:MAG: tyrosine-protein phosphatase, partial [Microthrixaceae bacterium]